MDGEVNVAHTSPYDRVLALGDMSRPIISWCALSHPRFRANTCRVKSCVVIEASLSFRALLPRPAVASWWRASIIVGRTAHIPERAFFCSSNMIVVLLVEHSIVLHSIGCVHIYLVALIFVAFLPPCGRVSGGVHNRILLQT